MSTPAAVAVWLVVLVVVAVLVWLVWRWLRRPRVGATGANPNPAYITDEMWWLWTQLQALEPTTQLGGIYANKPGYHNTRYNLPSWDYSVCDDPPDQDGPGDKAAAIDWTFPDAQGGNYDRIATYTKRLLNSAQDPDDPRLDGWREFYGNADDDSYVEGWDIRYNVAATSDSSHLWHIHISENRDQTTSKANKEALLSVLKGESVADWLRTGAEGNAAVLLNCPFDEKRQDFFYVSPIGEVWHRWFTGGINTLWSGGGSSENLGGQVAPGTLTAQWTADASSVYIAGLGTQDGKGPVGAGQFWGMSLGSGGTRSGWGSFEKCYGAYPGVATAPPVKEWTTGAERHALAIAGLALLVAVVVLVLQLVG